VRGGRGRSATSRVRRLVHAASVRPHLGGGHRRHRLWWSFLALQLTGFYQEAASPETDREGGDVQPQPDPWGVVP